MSTGLSLPGWNIGGAAEGGEVQVVSGARYLESQRHRLRSIGRLPYWPLLPAGLVAVPTPRERPLAHDTHVP